MGVVYAEELWDGRQASEDWKHHRTYTRKYEVRTDSPYDDGLVVGGSPLLPRLGYPYISMRSVDPAALVASIDPEQSADDPTLWYVTVKYDTQFEGTGQTGSDQQQPKDRPENPLNQPPSFKFGLEKTTRALVYDQNNKPIVNSAGFPFDPPLEEEISYLTMAITVNKAVWFADTAPRYAPRVNKTKFLGFDKRMVKCTGVEASSAMQSKWMYWQVTWNLVVNTETWNFPPDDVGQGWDRRILDCGYFELNNDVPPKPVKILDRYGKEPTGPYPLLHGKKLPAGNDPVCLTFRALKEEEFNGVIP